MTYRETLIRQFDIAWKLASFHLAELSTPECLWRPSRNGPHVQLFADGVWRADWPDRESYDIGPPSIAWLTWHIGFWWSIVLDHSFGAGTLKRENIIWAGDAERTIAWLHDLKDRWRAMLDQLADEDLASKQRTRWPFTDRPFGDVVAWVNIELTKNAAEIGYARFLYATRDR